MFYKINLNNFGKYFPKYTEKPWSHFIVLEQVWYQYGDSAWTEGRYL